MPPRFNASKFRSQLRQAEQKQRQAVRQLTSAANRLDREARAYDARARTHQSRLQAELRRLNAAPTSSSRYTTSTIHVRVVQERFTAIESAVESGRWEDPDDLLGLTEAEAADSVASLNQMFSDDEKLGEPGELGATTLTTELADIDPELQDRWTGALFALNPRNPDAARHFCTSAREMLTAVLDVEAPDADVKAANEDYIRTPNGGVSRRAKIHHCLSRRGNAVDEMVDFVDADIDGVIALFDDFNQGTHGAAGRFPLAELTVLKGRVEKAVLFIHRLVRG